MSKEFPADDTIEYVDYLLEALVEETLIHAYFGENETAVDFHIGLLRAAYQRALERKEEKGTE